jgi:hypothetical protein
MILGFVAMFCLFAGLSLLFASSVITSRHRRLFMIGGMALSIIPLILLLTSLFYPIWE